MALRKDQVASPGGGSQCNCTALRKASRRISQLYDTALAPIGNMQRWRFLVIRDPKVKETVGALYKRARDEQVTPRYRAGEPTPGMSRERFCGCSTRRNIWPRISMRPRSGSSLASKAARRPARPGRPIYPAVQNMLLAARALGLGATLTTLYLQFEEFRLLSACRPVSTPMPYCRSRTRWAVWARPPYCADHVVYEDRWGQPYPDCAHLPASVIVFDPEGVLVTTVIQSPF